MDGHVISSMKDALNLIAGSCETFHGGHIRCWDTDRTPDALYGGARWCNSCIAKWALMVDEKED